MKLSEMNGGEEGGGEGGERKYKTETKKRGGETQTEENLILENYLNLEIKSEKHNKMLVVQKVVEVAF